MSVVLPVPYRCPECFKAFVSLGWISSSTGPEYHTDLHRPALGASILPALVAVCPHCGCADWTAEFDHAREHEDDLPESLAKGAGAYAEVARQAADRGASDGEVAAIWLRGGWCARDLAEAELERACQREALACYRRAWMADGLPRRERQVAAYLIGELHRRLGQTDAALAWWDEHLTPDDTEDWAALLAVVRPLAEAGEARNAVVSGVSFGPRPLKLDGPQGDAMTAIDEGRFGPAIDLDDPALAPHLLDALGAKDGAARQAAQTALEVLAPIMLETLFESADLKPVPGLLAKVGDPRALEPLLSALRHRRRPRREVVDALATLGDRRAFGPLAELSTEPRWTPGLATALAWLGGPRARDLLWSRLTQEHQDGNRELIEALDLIDALADPDLAKTASDLVGLDGGEIIARLDPEGTAERLAEILPDLTGRALLDAAQWLVHLGHRPSAEMLLPLLDDRSEAVVRDAILMLGHLGDPAAVEPLIAWLTRPWRDPRGLNALDVEGSWREAPTGRYRNEASDLDRLPAIWALGQLRDPRAYEALVALTAAPTRLMRPYAVYALGCLGDRRALDALLALAQDATHELSQPGIVALGKLGDPRAAHILSPIMGGGDHRALPAIEALGELGGDTAATALIDYLSAAKPSYAEAAIRALARTRDGHALPTLLRYLGHRYAFTAAAAAKALGELGDGTAIAALEAVLAGNWHVQQAAIASLEQLGRTVPKVPYVSPAHVTPLEGWYPLPALLHDLNSDDHYDRWPALQALAQDAAGDLLVPLAEQIGDEEPAIREASAEALRLVCDHLRRLGGFPGEAAVPVLYRWLRDERRPVGVTAAECLAGFDSEVARSALVATATEGSTELRCAALRALGVGGDPRSTGTLVGAVGDVEPAVRAAALDALDDPRAAGVVLDAADDPEPAVRVRAIAALARLGDSASLARVRAAGSDTDEAVRSIAQAALAELEPGPPAPPPEKPPTVPRSEWLRGLSGGHNANFAVHLVSEGLVGAVPALVRHRARGEVSDEKWSEALAGAGPEKVEVLIGLLEQVDPARRAAAADALGRCGDHNAMVPLLATLDDEAAEVRVAAAEALGRLGGPRAEEPLRTALVGPDTALRCAAASALGSFASPPTVVALTAALDDEAPTVRKQAMAALRRRHRESPPPS